MLRGFGLAKALEAVSLPMGTEINLLANQQGDPVELHRDELYKHRRCGPWVPAALDMLLPPIETQGSQKP